MSPTSHPSTLPQAGESSCPLPATNATGESLAAPAPRGQGVGTPFTYSPFEKISGALAAAFFLLSVGAALSFFVAYFLILWRESAL